MDGDYTLYTGVRGISIGTWTSVYGFTGPFVLGWGAFHVRLLCMLVTIYLRSYIVEDSSMGGSRIEALFRQLHVPFPSYCFSHFRPITPRQKPYVVRSLANIIAPARKSTRSQLSLTLRVA